MTPLLELAARLQSAGALEGILLVLLKATLILLIARLLLLVMSGASAATRHVVATVALVAVAALPVMSIVLPAWHVATARPAATATPQTAASGATPAPSRTVGATDAESEGAGGSIGTAISVVRATGVVPDEPLTAMSRALNVTKSTWKGIIAIGFLTGTLLIAAQMAVGMAVVWLVARRGEEISDKKVLAELRHAREALGLGSDVRLLRSARITMPVLWGFFKPVLLLPADVSTWPAERLRVVLMHELAHLVRFDGISLIVTRLAVAAFWYHPLAWSLERAGRSECERACDDLVLSVAGTKPSDYADHLLAIARGIPTFDPFHSVTLAMTRKSQLEGRLLSILQPHVVRRVLKGRGVAVACAAAVALIIPFSALRLTAKPQEPAEIAETKKVERSGTEVTVTHDVEAIENYFLAKLGKFDRRADRLLREPKNAREWYERAWDLYRNERYEDAAAAFRRAAAGGERAAKSLYNAACSFALLGDAKRATATLSEAIAAGWDDFDHIAEDSDFDPIRKDPAFAQLVSRGGSHVASRRVAETVAKYEAMSKGKEVTRRDDSLGDFIAKAIGHGRTESWFEVGLDLLRVRQLDQSIDAFQRAIDAGQKPGTSMYNIACAFSLKGDAGNGLLWLDRSIENGFSSDEKLENDPDIALLRKQPGFAALRQKAKDLEMRVCCDRGKWGEEERAGWRAVAAHHKAVAAKYPQSGRAWFNLGFSALQARDFATATDAFERAIALRYRVGTSSYNIACGMALQGRQDAAFEWLRKARTAGFELHQHMDGDEDLEALHDDPRWEALRKEAGADRWHWKRKES